MTRNKIIILAFLTITLSSGLAGAQETQPVPETSLDACRDGNDNDGDGHTDCADQDCEIYAICLEAPEEVEEEAVEETADDAIVIDDTNADVAADTAPKSSGVSVSKSVAPIRPKHEHSGFFFRGTGGVGAGGYYTSGEANNLDLDDDSDTHIEDFDTTTGLSLSIGGSLAKNLLLHADFTTIDVSDDDDNSNKPGMDVFGLGIGITKYWMPVNVYLTGSIGPSMSLLNDGDEDYDNVAFGVIGKASVGKEWWVSENWGLGIAAQANYSYTTLNSVHFQEASFVAVFSATYN
ncbi:MAG: hypothetical protein GY854_12600 [Deltaproteobacteria bacterium]|nr:hypothetical protein [Deltaproteobacteria bacterium]